MATSTAGGPQIAPHGGMWTRVTARLHSRQLDQALAHGTPPEAAAPLALRARRLTALAHRRAVADSLRRAVRDSCQGVPPSLAIAPDRSQVIAASDDLIRLADALATPGPVAARGVAQARILLTDGTGPLYTMKGNLRARAASAAAYLSVEDTGLFT
jgi:hypothetical protein